MKAETRRKILFCLPVLLILFGLFGCSPMKETVELYGADSVSGTAAKSLDEIARVQYDEAEKNETEKYQKIPGNRAFYLLPAGVPLPGGICSFTFLDFLSDNTTVYAYQILYALPQENGLGGMGLSGKKGKDDPVGTSIFPYVTEEMRKTGPFPREIFGPVNPEGGRAADKLVTLLMAYNFETEEYRVLFHDVETVTPHYILQSGAEAGEEQEGDSVSLLLDNEIVSYPEGRLDLSQLKAVRISSGEYALYYKEHIYRIDLSGTVKEEKTVSRDLVYAMKAGSHGMTGERTDSELWHVEDFSADADGTEWLLLQCVDEEAMETEDSETTDSSVRQVLLTSAEEKGNPFFTSENVAVKEQMNAFLRSDWSTVDFGRCEEKPTEKQILEVIGSGDSIRQAFPDQYDPYIMEREDLNRIYRLCVPDAEGRLILPGGETELDPGWDWHVAVEQTVGEETAYSDAHLGPQANPFLNYVHEEEYERHVRVTWETEVEEEVTNPDGSKEIRKVWKPQSTEYTDSMKFTFEKYCQIPVEKLTWYWNVPYEGALSGAPYQGVVQWNTMEADVALEGDDGTTRLFWDAAGAPCFLIPKTEDGARGITLPHQADLLDLQEESFDGLSEKLPVLYTEDPSVINIFYNFENNQAAENRKWPAPLVVSKLDISYGKQTNDKMQSILGFTAGALRLRKENGSPWLYAASLQEGLTKFYLGNKEERLKVKGPERIWPYPCLRIYSAEENDAFYVFGFRVAENTFDADDLPFARVYEVDLFGKESCENIISSALENPENEEYRWNLLNVPINSPEYENAWENFYQCLGLGNGQASQSILSEIRSKTLKQWSAAMKFLVLSELQDSENRVAIVGEILAADTVQELESVFVKNTKIHVPEEDEPEPKGKGDSPEEIERSRSVAQEQWHTRIRLAKIQKLRESKKPPVSETAWEEELEKILEAMGKSPGKK